MHPTDAIDRNDDDFIVLYALVHYLSGPSYHWLITSLTFLFSQTKTLAVNFSKEPRLFIYAACKEHWPNDESSTAHRRASVHENNATHSTTASFQNVASLVRGINLLYTCAFSISVTVFAR